MGLQAKTATVVRDGKEMEIPIEEVVVGDIVFVKPGEKIPVDGEIVEGHQRLMNRCLQVKAYQLIKQLGISYWSYNE